MAANATLLESGLWNIPPTAGIQALAGELTRAGQLYLEKIGLAIDEAAPRPGLLVYVSARKLEMPLNGLDAVVFSAVDVYTHLQVAQAYHALTTASAISFIEFAAGSFPFAISQIRTPDERPFATGVQPSSPRDFSVMVGKMGIIHSPVRDAANDALSSITAKTLYAGHGERYTMHATSNDLQRELAQFLFFHNNYRSIPWLSGKTPLQRLKMFEEFSRLHVFSVFDELEGGRLLPDSVHPALRQGRHRSAAHS